ncbi:MAG: hypothetical protein JWQ20_3166 [Conexibacter sp.]|nr:hypothetical protein [Conexibacter sp.]
MTRIPRLLAPLCVATAFAALAPSAQAVLAVSTVNFPSSGTPQTTVSITDPGPSSPTVHLTVTPADPSKLAATKVFLGPNGRTSPEIAVGTDGVHDARYADGFDGDQLSTASCAVYDSDIVDAPVTVSGSSYSADLPKGVDISRTSIGVDVGIVGLNASCTRSGGYHGLTIDFLADNQDIDGFSWQAAAAPVVTATGGRRQVTLDFAREPGTTYDIYRVVDGVRQSTPFFGNINYDGGAHEVVLGVDADGNSLDPGTSYAFQVVATRNFSDDNDNQPTSPFSATATATTAAVQVLHYTAGPAASTTSTTAEFAWSIDAAAPGDTPDCYLDITETSGTYVPCGPTGAAISGLGVGSHTLTVYPAYGEAAYPYTWVVTAPAAAPAPVVTPAPHVVAPIVTKDPSDTDGDGIKNTWLVGGKPAAAPARPTAHVTSSAVKLTLPRAPKGAKKVRVYRADGKGGYKLVKTVSAKGGSFTDKSVKSGHTYKYKTVAVNAKGQQGKASSAVKAVVKKKKTTKK